MIHLNDLKSCPDPVRRYLIKAGVVGQKRVRLVHVTHTGEFRLKPDQKWYTISGDYHFDVHLFNFRWTASIKIFPFFRICVTDGYQNGVGRSLVKLGTWWTLADQTGSAISESSLGRLLVELVLSPTALVPNENLRWEHIDSHQARVVLKNYDFEVSALFLFRTDGLPEQTSIDRFGIFDKKIQKKAFVCELSKYSTFQGLKIPTDINGSWIIGNKPFRWLHFKIQDVLYKS